MSEMPWYHSLTASRGGIILPLAKGEAVILDKTGRFAATVRPDAPDPGANERHLAELFDLAEAAAARAELGFRVVVDLATIYQSAELRNGLPHLLDGLTSAGRAEVLVCFSRPPRDWMLFAHWAYHVIRELPVLQGRVRLRGPFDMLAPDTRDAFFSLGLRLEYVAGWSPGATMPGIADPEALQALARFGYRVPLVSYVHDANIGLVEQTISEALKLNQHSGFSVPPVFEHLEYTASVSPPLADQYVELLTRLYSKYPSFDDVSEPMADLVRGMSEGAWQGQSDVPTPIQIVARDAVGVFRHTPSRAVRWAGWSDVVAMQVAEIGRRVTEFHASHLSPTGHPICRHCQWRQVCGGSDVSAGGNDAIFEVSCSVRMKFLETLARQKAEVTQIVLPSVHSTQMTGYGVS